VPDLAGPLLAWFSTHRRALPWREQKRDPYRVWVSEVMLQQTRVEVVVPYFERFVRRFPTLRALAQAPIDEVLALWSGLGYYARARNLHRAAQAALQREGGLPRTAAGLRELPGFGPYTAAAVASLAFGEHEALVDGNVARVLSRVLRLPGDAAQARAAAWRAAPALLPPGRAGEFNEALMELGATLCTPRSPRCGECPLAARCAAHAHGDAEAFPAPKPRKERPRLNWAALALRRSDGAVLLARRAPGELFAGLWELPSAEVPADAPADLAAAAVLARHALPPGCARTLRPAGQIEQTLTHRHVTVRLFAARVSGRAPPQRDGLRWVDPRSPALGALGLSSLASRSLRACGIAAPPRPGR
jgi:A/G-specific adenine glycosylase